MQHPTGRNPHTVLFVGLGPSKSEFLSYLTRHEPPVDVRGDGVEVWTLNTGIRHVRHDLAFVMDDLRLYATRFPQYGRHLKTHDRPIITNTVYPDYPTAVEYPLGEVLELVDFPHNPELDYFRNSVPYILVYALLVGVKRLLLFGVDYDHPDGRRETGRACTEHWIGYIRARGIRVEVCPTSALLDQRLRQDHPQWLYGYLRQPVIAVDWQKEPSQAPTDGGAPAETSTGPVAAPARIQASSPARTAMAERVGVIPHVPEWRDDSIPMPEVAVEPEAAPPAPEAPGNHD